MMFVDNDGYVWLLVYRRKTRKHVDILYYGASCQKNVKHTSKNISLCQDTHVIYILFLIHNT